MSPLCYKNTFIDPATVFIMCLLSFIFVIVCGAFQWKRICKFFSIVCLNLYCCWT